MNTTNWVTKFPLHASLVRISKAVCLGRGAGLDEVGVDILQLDKATIDTYFFLSCR